MLPWVSQHMSLRIYLRLKGPRAITLLCYTLKGMEWRDWNWEREGESMQWILAQYNVTSYLCSLEQRDSRYSDFLDPSLGWLCNKKSSTKLMVGLNPIHRNASQWFSNPLFSIRCSPSWGQGPFPPLYFHWLTGTFHVSTQESVHWLNGRAEQFYKKDMSATETTFLFLIICKSLRGMGAHWKSWSWSKFNIRVVFGPQLILLCPDLSSGGLSISQGDLSFFGQWWHDS